MSDVRSWRPCEQHPTIQIPPYDILCLECRNAIYRAAEEQAREKRISETVEIVRRCLPLIVAAIREVDAVRDAG